MNESTTTLFDEYATRYRRGEAPDVLDYLERAGDDREALADLIDRFLEAVPARTPSEEELVLMRARLKNEPPLLALRVRRKLSRAAVVDAIIARLGLDTAKRDKVARYYHELETGLLDPEPINPRLWDTLSDFLGANIRALAGVRPAPPPPSPAFHRGGGMELHMRLIVTRAVDAPQETPGGPDEIDMLFTGR
jgi:hypothetical protein